MQKKFIKIGAKKIYIGEVLPSKPPGSWRAPDPFGLNPPNQLVIRYRWLAFLNQVRLVADAVVKVSNSIRILCTKSTISQKVENLFCVRFKTYAYLGTKFILTFLVSYFSQNTWKILRILSTKSTISQKLKIG